MDWTLRWGRSYTKEAVSFFHTTAFLYGSLWLASRQKTLHEVNAKSAVSFMYKVCRNEENKVQTRRERGLGIMDSLFPIECWNSWKRGYEKVTSEFWLDHDSSSHFFTYWMNPTAGLKWRRNDQKPIDLLTRHLICFKPTKDQQWWIAKSWIQHWSPEEHIWEFNFSCFELR